MLTWVLSFRAFSSDRRVLADRLVFLSAGRVAQLYYCMAGEIASTHLSNALAYPHAVFLFLFFFFFPSGAPRRGDEGQRSRHGAGGRAARLIVLLLLLPLLLLVVQRRGLMEPLPH